jgi:hypothetical protein
MGEKIFMSYWLLVSRKYRIKIVEFRGTGFFAFSVLGLSYRERSNSVEQRLSSATYMLLAGLESCRLEGIQEYQ